MSDNFSQAEMEHLTSLRFMNKIDDHLFVVSSIAISELGLDVPQKISLILNVFYDGEPIENLSFDLKNYSYEEIIKIAGNLKQNEFILYEIDNLLAGEIE